MVKKLKIIIWKSQKFFERLRVIPVVFLWQKLFNHKVSPSATQSITKE